MEIQLTIFLAMSSMAMIAVPALNKFGENDDYSSAERTALNQLRELVGPLPQPYMNTDGFLINWIRGNKDTTGGLQVTRNGTYYAITLGQGFDLNKAAKKLEKTLAWRKENNIDQILSEDFSDLQKEYPFDVSRKDKEGRPVILIEFANWDIKKATGATGTKKAKFVRYLDYILENGATQARKLKSTDYIYLTDVAGFNTEHHACLECLLLYQYWVQHFETHYPHMTKNMLHVNAPKSFDVVTKVLSSNLAPASKLGLKVYDNNKDKWLKEVGKIIPVDQIPKHFVQPTTTTKKPTRVIHWANACAGCKVPEG